MQLNISLLVSISVQLRQIFRANNWDRHESSNANFEKLLTLLYNLSPEESDLVIDLLNRFDWLSADDYQRHIKNILDQTLLDFPEMKNAYFFPIITKEQEGKTKSSHIILYLITALKYSLHNDWEKINIRVMESFSNLDESCFATDKNNVLILVDDFIGSGNSAKKCIEQISEHNANISKTDIAVATICIQQVGLNTLEEIPIKCNYSMLHKKGISDYYTGADREKNITLMQNIEMNITRNKKYNFGYEQSEALVKFIRTPNNTFPVFWMPYAKGKSKIEAAFPRT